jgi:hypothetical protein
LAKSFATKSGIEITIKNELPKYRSTKYKLKQNKIENHASFISENGSLEDDINNKCDRTEYALPQEILLKGRPCSTSK